MLCARLSLPPPPPVPLWLTLQSTHQAGPPIIIWTEWQHSVSLSPPTVYSIICLVVVVVVVGLYSHSNVDMKQVRVSYLSFDEKL
jgi:hypothetical protein